MAFLRKNNKESWTSIPNSIIRDDNLSLKDVGLLVSMLSLPDNWEFSENGLEQIYKNDGQTSIRTGLKNLEKTGYLKRERARDEKGKIIAYNWFLSDTPIFKNGIENPHLENQSMENQSLENPPQLNTKQLNTKKTTTNEKEKEKERKKERKTSTYDEILASVEDEELRELFYEYIKMRKMIKAPMTDRALQMLIKKVYELESTVNRQKELLTNAIMNNWKSVYPLKDIRQAPQTQGGNVFLDIAREEGIF